MEKYKKTLRIRIALFGSVILLNAVLSICQRIMDDRRKIPAMSDSSRCLPEVLLYA